MPFRTSGLIGGAKLELVQRSNTPSAVQIALQIPQPEAKEIPGGRLIKKFPSDLTLWQVMRQFESGEASASKNVNITARGYASTTSGSGQLFYETPVLNIMGREFSTFEGFQKTLSQLGHNSGNVLIRLGYKQTDQTLFEAMEQISQFFKDAAEKENSVMRQDSGETNPDGEKLQETVMADNTSDLAGQHHTSQTQKQPAGSDTDPSVQESGSVTATSLSATSDPYRPVNIFLAPSGDTPAAASFPATESDFTPTIAHAQLHQARLLESSRNKRLLSDKELREKAVVDEARIAAVKSVLVKVRFPDNTSGEWQVGPQETGSFLYQAVRHVMADPSHKFHLSLPGSKTIISDSTSQTHNLVKGYKLFGRVLLNLVWDDSVPATIRTQPFLKGSMAEQGQEIKVPEVPEVPETDSAASAPQQDAKEEKKEKGDGIKKVPKWLKLGKR